MDMIGLMRALARGDLMMIMDMKLATIWKLAAVLM